MSVTKKLLVLAAVGTTLAATGVASASVSHPAPSPIIDTWDTGRNRENNYAWSNYYVETGNYGSESAVRNIYGYTKDHQRRNFGWANSSATKAWNDVRIDTSWNFYRY
ncbi:hypothetical protein AB3K25_09115 [Leuconostoc sp. MS02]|uniref:Lactococcin 972 family bacteriocin n=1 Tax=Leuconostoc aquikimchii TaxID=3236804 RepID=A0ABV3S0L3_9LACO